jgi:hypothetical protein
MLLSNQTMLCQRRDLELLLRLIAAPAIQTEDKEFTLAQSETCA